LACGSDDIVAVASDEWDRNGRGNPILGMCLRRWSISDKRLVSEVLVRNCDNPSERMALSPDHSLIAIAIASGNAAIYGLRGIGDGGIVPHETKALVQLHGRTPRPSARTPDELEATRQMIFSKDGSVVYLRDERSPSVRLYDAKSGALLTATDPGGVIAQLIAVAPNGALVGVAGADGLVRMVTGDLHEVVHTFDFKPGRPAMAFSADSKRFAVKSAHDAVQVIDVDNGACIRTVAGYADGVNCVAISSVGHLAIGCAARKGDARGAVAVIDVTSGATVVTLR
jgi:WD40 repeat protein